MQVEVPDWYARGLLPPQEEEEEKEPSADMQVHPVANDPEPMSAAGSASQQQVDTLTSTC